MKPILSINDLSSRLGIRVARLREIANDTKSHYRVRPLVDEKKQKVRMLRVPTPELKDIQRRIKNNILAPIPLGKRVHGGVRGRSPCSNAAPHLGQPCVINLDVRDFFPNVRHYMVYRMFRHELGFGHDVARLLTRLTTLNSELPQGAPTSTAVANLLLAQSVDGPIAIEAERREINCTRFVDDITISGRDPRPFINVVARMLSRKRLPMYRKKAKWHSKPKLIIASRSTPQEVTGLVVNSVKGPSVSRRRRDKIRAAIFALRDTTDKLALATSVNSIRGKIAYVQQSNPGAAKRMQQYLELALTRRGSMGSSADRQGSRQTTPARHRDRQQPTTGIME